MLKLQPKPTFKKTVEFFDPEGNSLGKGEFVFKYQSMEQWSKYLLTLGTEGGPQNDFEVIASFTESTDAIDGEVSSESIKAFCSQLNSAAGQIIGDYVGALGKARRKN